MNARFAGAIAAALLLLAGMIPGQTAAADDPPGATKPAAKSGPAKPATKGAKPAAAEPRSIAGDLLDDAPSDLDNQLLDGLPPAKRSPAKKPPARSPDKDKPADADVPPVTEGPVLSDGGDPLVHIAEQMRALERRLEASRPGDAETDELQTEIVDELARLIKKMEEQQNGQRSSSTSKQPPSSASQRKSVQQPEAAPGNTPATDKRPAKESTERLGKSEVRQPDADDIHSLMKDVWGQLPREREQMLQSPPEQFLPKYELLLEKYYKRLADEQRQRP